MASASRAALPLLLTAGLALPAAAQNTKPAAPAPKPAPAASKAQARPAQAPAATRPAAPKNDEVLATVNGEPIRRSEVAKLLAQFSVPPGSEAKAYDSAMDLLVNNKVLAQFLRAQKVQVPAPDIDKVIAQYRDEAQRNGTKLESELASNDMTMEEFRNRVALTLQWKKYVMDRATEAELRKYADANKEAFNGTLVRASHILVKLDPGAPEAEKQKARSKAAAIKQEIEGGKIGFADAANKYSEDPGNRQTPSGGDLEFFPRKGQFIESFSAAAFGMKKGEISDPVETEYGYHLIQVTDRREGKPYDFERDREEILTQYAAELQAKVVEDQRKQAKVEIKPMPAGLITPDTAPVGEPAKGAARPADPKAAAPKPAATKPAATKPATPQP